MEKRGKFRMVLAGNPNSGKTTIFNQLTGARQHVGNYPGVTVEEKTGRFSVRGLQVEAADLPGTYSLTGGSPEELIARDVITRDRPDLVLNVVDASNIERNLYLTLQLIELGAPVVIALNMVDDARKKGVELNTPLMERLLGVRIVETVGHQGRGLDQLKGLVADIAEGKASTVAASRLGYGPELEDALAKLCAMMTGPSAPPNGVSPRWLAIKLLEKDREAARIVRGLGGGSGGLVAEAAEKLSAAIEREHGVPGDIFMAERRYGVISGICAEAARLSAESAKDMSDRVDALLAHRVFGLPIFLVMMWLVFKLTFSVGEPLSNMLDMLFHWIGASVSAALPPSWGPMPRSLLVDGVIGGVGGVLVFLPNIMLLFLALAALEGSGYMARAAFLMDNFMHKLGLHGKSFIPMLVGFGCSVPAIMATRTLESRRDRMTTMLVLPLISCGARLPIYTLIIPAFFPEQWRAAIMMTVYLVGILLVVVCAKLLRMTAFRGENEAFVMELPPYRMPTPRSVLIHMWERGYMYLRKAGTTILAASLILWALTTFPQKTVFEKDYDAMAASMKSSPHDEASKKDALKRLDNERDAEKLLHSAAGRIGRAMEPVLSPLGFDWRIGTALIGAFAAKEIFVSQMGIVCSIGGDADEGGLRDELRRLYTPLQGFCVMLFCLISAPCMATIAVTRRESNSWKLALFQLAGLTLLAYAVTLAVYQAGMLLGIGCGLL